jgi:N-methylhydantoinase A
MSPLNQGNLRVGIDTGGTFTDIVMVEGGRMLTAKVPSCPDSPALAVLDGLDKTGERAGLVCHGTTVGTNAILARHGGPACMVVTKGFRDVLEIGRGERIDLYSKSPSRPKPIFPWDLIFEIDARLDASGNVLSTPTIDQVEQIAEIIEESGSEAIGVGLLHSAAWPGPEQELSGLMSALTTLPTYPSSELAAYPREYERWNLAAVAAYLSPVLGSYLEELADKCPATLALMASSGGLISSDQALDNPALCVLSGPAGGALAALSLGRERILALDMGGTSTDVTLLAGHLPRTREAEIDGLPLPLPTIDIHTIGAGGGSIVKFDAGGMLALGPESAGAMPGPACYRNGGPATLSDIALLSGRLPPSHFLGGEMSIDADFSMKALDEIRPPSMTFDELLDGVNELAKVHLAGALRRISVGRGIDPSNPKSPFTLVPFGGAGALYGVECARVIGLKEVLHPRSAGVFSAIGLLQAPISSESERAILKRVRDSLESIASSRQELELELGGILGSWSEKMPVFTATLECRYRGQTHTLEIPLRANAPDSITEDFENAYKSRYTYLHHNAEIEVVTIRVRGELIPPKIDFPDIPDAERDMADAQSGNVRMRVEREWIDAPVYLRDNLPIESELDGPALVVEDFATLFLPPDTSMHLDRKGHAVVELK